MDSRQQFEEWYAAASKGWPDAITVCCKETMWGTWQASRKCIVIDLPPSIGVTPIGGDGIQEYIDCNGEYLHGFAVVESIINAGLTLK